jgi:uncharacterized protein DUF6922
MAGVPDEHRWVFWEADCDAIDTETHADYILARVLEFGGIEEVRWAVATYGMDRIHAFFRDVGHVEISERTKRFWRVVFRAENETWADPGGWRRSNGAPWIA